MFFAATSLPAQVCQSKTATSFGCVTRAWVQALTQLQMMDDDVTSESKKIQDPIEAGFFAVKTRLRVEAQVFGQLESYQVLPDSQAAKAARQCRAIRPLALRGR